MCWEHQSYLIGLMDVGNKWSLHHSNTGLRLLGVQVLHVALLKQHIDTVNSNWFKVVGLEYWEASCHLAQAEWWQEN